MVLLITRDVFYFIIGLAHPHENKSTQTGYYWILLNKTKKEILYYWPIHENRPTQIIRILSDFAKKNNNKKKHDNNKIIHG